jgi:hypothetical protein
MQLGVIKMKKFNLIVLVLSTIAIASLTHAEGAIPPRVEIPCGLTGSIEERIEGCAYIGSPIKEGFILVTRTEKLKEVYQEISTGFLWSDRLDLITSHYRAQKACSADLDEMGGLSELKWKLPSREEFQQAERNGIRLALPNMQTYFWSSTTRDNNNSDFAWLFNGGTGDVVVFGRTVSVSVRCIASPL